MSVWRADWLKIVNSLVVETGEMGRRSVDLVALLALQSIPLCQIWTLQDDPRGKVVDFDEVTRERRRKRDEKRQREAKEKK